MKKTRFLIPLSLLVFLFISCKIPSEDIPTEKYPGMTKFELDDLGGTIEDESGLTILVPENAVSGAADIYIKELDPTDFPGAFSESRIAPEEVLFVFRGEVDTGEEEFESFDTPVTATIPVPGLERGAFIIIREFDPVTGNLQPSSHSYTVNYSETPGEETIELELEHFCGLSIEQKAELEKAKTECQDPVTACRCSNRYVVSDNRDYSIERAGDEQSCYFVHDYLEAQYLDCPGTPSESFEFIEISDVCEPNLTITADTLVIEPGDTVNLEALFKIGNAPFTGKNVTFSMTGPGTLYRTDEVTDAGGTAANTVTATDTGEIVVTANGTGRYYLYEKIIKENDVIKEEEHQNPRDVDESDSITIHVIHKPEMVLTAEESSIGEGESTTITATVTQNDEPVPDVGVNFMVSGPASLSSSFNTTNEFGECSVTLTASDEQGIAIVKAESSVETSLNGEQSKIFPLIEQVEVSIGERIQAWTGTLEYRWEENDSGHPYNELAIYTLDFNFIYDTESTFLQGTAKGTQEISIITTDSSYWVENIDSSPYELPMNGSGADNLYLCINKPDFDWFASFDLYHIDDEGNVSSHNRGCGVNQMVIDSDNSFNAILFEEGTQSGNWTFDEYGIYATHSYTISLHRVE